MVFKRILRQSLSHEQLNPTGRGSAQTHLAELLVQTQCSSVFQNREGLLDSLAFRENFAALTYCSVSYCLTNVFGSWLNVYMNFFMSAMCAVWLAHPVYLLNYGLYHLWIGVWLPPKTRMFFFFSASRSAVGPTQPFGGSFALTNLPRPVSNLSCPSPRRAKDCVEQYFHFPYTLYG